MSFAKLDVTTLQNLGWSSALVFPPVKYDGQQVPMASADGKEQCSLPNTSELVDLKDNANADPTFSYITKAEFRRLTRQLQESNNYSRKTRLGFLKASESEKLYRLTPAVNPDPATQALHLQLQASRTPFQSKLWRPLSQEDLCSSPFAKGRKRPTTACSSKPVHGPAATAPSERPRSVPVHGGRTPPSTLITEAGHVPRPPSTPRPSTPLVTPGDFDTLTPRVLSELLGDDPWPLSLMAYGDRIWERVGPKQSSKEIPRAINQDDISTSGFGSEGGEDDEEDDDDYNDEDESCESDSGGFEPSLEQARRNMSTAQSVFRLRPERLDAIYTPEDKRDMRRFDFDAGNVDTPPYLFTCPLPLPFSELNLQLCAREDRDWRKQLSLPLPESGTTQNMCTILDRLVQLEKAQILTEEWEARKLRKQSRRQQSSGSSFTRSRSASARMRDKRCCGLCLQVACVGNCPEKWLATDGRCDKCRQLLCTGACQDTRYEQRMRQLSGASLGVGDKSPATSAPRPPSRGCHLCKERNNAKIINSNNLLLGRPKSCNATFSRGKASNRPRDLRPTSAFDLSASLLKDFERLGIEPQQPLPQPKSLPSRTRSRNGLLPGKSVKSNRKNSISESRHKRKRFKASCTKTVS